MVHTSAAIGKYYKKNWALVILQVVRDIFKTSEGSTAYDMLMRIINRRANVQLVRSALFFTALFTFGADGVPSFDYRKGELLKAMSKVSRVLL